MNHRDVRARYPRSFGALEVAIVSVEGLRAWVELVELEDSGQVRARVAVRAEELDAVGECRRLLLGHPAQEPKGVDPVLRGAR
jgi:hypothetical protein